MKRHATIVSTLALVAGLGVCAPAPAGASAPLLSGYGGPGTGSQAILGSALLGGGGSGGSSQSGGSGGAAAGTSAGAAGASSQGGGSSATGALGGASLTRGSSDAGGRDHGGRSPGPSAAHGSATHPGAAGAHPQTPDLQAGQAVASASPAWFSGADVLALALAAGVLALVGLATVRLARTQHH